MTRRAVIVVIVVIVPMVIVAVGVTARPVAVRVAAIPRPYPMMRRIPKAVRPRAIAESRTMSAEGLGTSPPATPIPTSALRDTGRGAGGAGVMEVCWGTISVGIVAAAGGSATATASPLERRAATVRGALRSA